jgi:SAM-dependent methyltransferase
MKLKTFLRRCLTGSKVIAANGSRIIDITKYGFEQYQDILVDDRIEKEASPPHPRSELRYQLIADVLKRYTRPFTMLDIGASQGYYSFRAAHDYDCVCVMIEGNNDYYPMIGQQLLEICHANRSLNNLVLLQKPIIPEDLARLSECESFDVVLALNVIHWFGDKWKEVASSILDLGDRVIIETPPEEEFIKDSLNEQRHQIQEFLSAKGAELLAEVPRHTSSLRSPVYLYENPKTSLRRRHWLAPEASGAHLMIRSTDTQRNVAKPSGDHGELRTHEWIPGINLMTYLMYNGGYPSRAVLMAELKRLADLSGQSDWGADNVIVQGSRLALIERHCPGIGTAQSNEQTGSNHGIERHLRIVGVQNPEEIRRYFTGEQSA